jgi:Tol biopolymer transport system component
LTAFHGIETDPAISPDGKYVAFAWDGEKQDNFDIYIMEIGSRALRRITTDPAQDMSPAWSPDGRSIAFLRWLGEDRAALMLVPAAGGPEHRVAETRNEISQRLSHNLVSLAWLPDGRWVAASHREVQELPGSIYLFSVTGEKRRFTTPPEDSFGDHMPALSPDGRKLAFSRLLSLANSEVYLLSLDQNYQPEGEVVRLTNHKRWSVNPVWVGSNSEVWYVFNQHARPQIPREVRIASITGDAAPERKLSIDDEVRQIRSSGRHLVYSKQSRQDINIWRVEIPAAGEEPSVPELFISSTALDNKARYSPDGKKISFVSSRSGAEELWVSNAHGSDRVPITSWGGPLFGPAAWSPDGQWLVFHARPEGQADLFVMPAAGGTPRRLTNHPSDDANPTYSRDGRWIYFSSIRTGRLQVFRMPSGGGDAIQITTGGGRRPIESPDGKTLFHLSEGGNAIRQMPIAGGVETDVVTSVCPEFGFALTREGLLLYPARAPSSSGDSCEFRLLVPATGKSRLLARVPAQPLGLIASISPDGRHFLFDQAEKRQMDLMLIENFLSR